MDAYIIYGLLFWGVIIYVLYQGIVDYSLER